MLTSICQPHFFPWLGYFNMLYLSEKFIFLDNVQYNRRSWQNRVHIRHDNTNEKKFISLSIKNNSRSLFINKTFFYRDSLEKIERILYEVYKNTKYFKKLNNFILDLIYNNNELDLASYNINIIQRICQYLNINLNYKLSSEINLDLKKRDLILGLLNATNSKKYLANNGSLNYADKDFFHRYDIKFYTHDFIHPKYDQYSQKNLKFVDNLSIIDLLFNCEKESEDVVKLYNPNFI